METANFSNLLQVTHAAQAMLENDTHSFVFAHITNEINLIVKKIIEAKETNDAGYVLRCAELLKVNEKRCKSLETYMEEQIGLFGSENDDLFCFCALIKGQMIYIARLHQQLIDQREKLK